MILTERLSCKLLIHQVRGEGKNCLLIKFYLEGMLQIVDSSRYVFSIDSLISKFE